jgi:hypothetical protein
MPAQPAAAHQSKFGRYSLTYFFAMPMRFPGSFGCRGARPGWSRTASDQRRPRLQGFLTTAAILARPTLAALIMTAANREGRPEGLACPAGVVAVRHSVVRVRVAWRPADHGARHDRLLMTMAQSRGAWRSIRFTELPRHVRLDDAGSAELRTLGS